MANYGKNCENPLIYNFLTKTFTTVTSYTHTFKTAINHTMAEWGDFICKFDLFHFLIVKHTHRHRHTHTQTHTVTELVFILSDFFFQFSLSTVKQLALSLYHILSTSSCFFKVEFQLAECLGNLVSSQSKKTFGFLYSYSQ